MAEIVAEKSINEVESHSPRTRSTYDLNYRFYTTMRFGEYTPHFWLEGVDSDKLPLRSSHRIMSYTLKSPLLSDIKINKDYFFVPMQAILPLNWEKFITNPSIGQDVPSDCGPSVADFWHKIAVVGNRSLSFLRAHFAPGDSTFTAVSALDAIFKFFVFFERFYSDGSLMSNLGIHGSRYFEAYRNANVNKDRVSFDQVFDGFISRLIQANLSYFQFYDSNNVIYTVNLQGVAPAGSTNLVSLRDYLEMLRDDFSITISALVSPGTAFDVLYTAFTWIFGSNGDFIISTTPFTGTTGVASENKPALDLRRLWAYQLVCWHFYSNDKVDYIYNAELFRQYIRELTSINYSGSIMQLGSFTVNGLQYEYDALSAHCFDIVINSFGSDGIFSYVASGDASDSLAECYAYFRALFGFNRSLRFKDYFTSSRTQALAVGNTNVSVNSNFVSVIDITRNIQRQRFLNFVNRIPRQFEDYMAALLHKRPAPDYHNPFFLAHTSDVVFGDESEYTGNLSNANPNNITSVLKSNADRYAFEFEPDRDSVVLGLTSFDIPRAYSQSIERQAFHYDRFDAFNPFFQFIGDQSVYKAELGIYDTPTLAPFGYQTRHMEYKQRYDQCAGAFRHFLPGWLFIADDSFYQSQLNQNPDFIRSHNTELDRFFTSLTGYSLASYFHFIVKNTNIMSASRPMAYAPAIL